MAALLIEETEKRLICLWTQTFFGNVNSFFMQFSSSRNQFGRWLSVWKPSRLMQLHSAPFPSYARNGLISWRIGSLRPGHALSIYFVIIVGLWYSRWELDLFVTLSAETVDLVPRCHSEWRICSRCPRPRDPASQTVCAVKVMFSTAPTLTESKLSGMELLKGK